MKNIEVITEYLERQDITVAPVKVHPSFLWLSDEAKPSSVEWSVIAAQADTKINIQQLGAEAMSLASMAAVHMLDAQVGDSVLDVCAAPGMKSLYMSMLTQGIELHCNDVSAARIARMRRLLSKYQADASITQHDARYLDKVFEPESFDRILIDAPCSGEGVILGGNDKLLATWSPAKVKRLQQLQIKILRSSWALLRPGGRLVYSTCTLNKNENERVIHKALKIDVDVHESALSTDTLPSLKHTQAWRILLSINSIGFFVAVLEKQEEIE